MLNYKTNFKKVQTLYELCTNGMDLEEFCQESGANYTKFVVWQRNSGVILWIFPRLLKWINMQLIQRWLPVLVS